MPEEFSELLKRKREAAGLNPPALAKLSNTRQPTIWLVEKGKRNPPLDSVERWATALSLEGAELSEFMESARSAIARTKKGSSEYVEEIEDELILLREEIPNLRARAEQARTLERMLELLAKQFPGEIPGAADRSDDATYGDLVWEQLRVLAHRPPTDDADLRDAVVRACDLRQPTKKGRR